MFLTFLTEHLPMFYVRTLFRIDICMKNHGARMLWVVCWCWMLLRCLNGCKVVNYLPKRAKRIWSFWKVIIHLSSARSTFYVPRTNCIINFSQILIWQNSIHNFATWSRSHQGQLFYSLFSACLPGLCLGTCTQNSHRAT